MTHVHRAGRYLREQMSPWAIALLALITAAAFTIPFLFADPALGDHLDPGPPTTSLNVQPEQVDGNPTCSDLIGSGDFLFEFKFEPVADLDDWPLSFDGLSGELDVDVYNTPDGQAFDFDVSGDFVVAAVFVKAGPGGNFYDYRPDGANFPLEIFGDAGVGDTFLHGPINPQNNKFYGLSHISFCIAEAEAEIDIVKTAVDDEITVGEKAAFDITVTSLGPATAQNVTIDDELPNTTWDWEIVSEDITGACDITDGNTLHCDVGDLAEGESFSVRVQTTTVATAAECDTTLDNTAFAEADNAGEVSDDASITVECGAIKVVKTAKHADTSGATSANLEADFEITDSNGATHSVTTNATTGVACVDNLPLGAASVEETSGPTGYAEDPDTENVTVTENDCPEPGAGATALFENIPLTDVEININSQHDGATSTVVECWEGSDTSGDPDFSTTILGDGSLDMDGFEPTDPEVTLTCEITIDP